MEYATTGKANAGLTTGIIGTALGGIATLLPNLMGSNSGSNANYVCKDMFDLQNKLNAVEVKNAVLEANIEANGKFDKLRDEVHALSKVVNDNAASQAVINCGFQSNVAVLNSQTAQLFGLVKTVIPSTNVMTVASS